MPRVPYQPYPDEKPIEGTGAREISVGTPSIGPEAFGAQVGAALSGLGVSIGQSGNELFQRAEALQQLKNENEARDADAQYSMKSGVLHADFMNREGRNASPEALQAHIKQLNDLRTQIRGGLSNDRARSMYDASSLGFMNRNIFSAAGHAGEQMKQWTNSAVASSIDIAGNQIEQNPDDDKLFDDALAQARQGVRTQAGTKGYREGDPQYQELMQLAESKLYAHRIAGVNRTDPVRAGQMLDDAKTSGHLVDQDYGRLDSSIKSQSHSIGAANQAEKIYSENPGASVGELMDKARAKAQQDFPNDAKAANSYVKTIEGLYNNRKYADQQAAQSNVNTVDKIIMDNPNIKTKRDLLLSPLGAKAYNALPPNQQIQIDSRINNIRAAQFKVTNDEEKRRLFGMKSSDVEGFLNEDILSNPNLSYDDIKYFKNEQIKMEKDPGAGQDPRVNRALGWMRNSTYAQTLNVLGVDQKPRGDKTDYYQYVGAVQSALDVWKDAHGRAPTEKEFMDQIAPEIVRQQVVPSFSLGGKLLRVGHTNVPAYLPDVPEDFAKDVKAKMQQQAADAGQQYIEPTNEQLQAAYTRMQFIRIFGEPGTMKEKKGTGRVKP